MEIEYAATSRRPFFLALIVILASAGCGRNKMDKWEARRPKTHTVQGRVLLDGKPEADVVVSFESKVHNLTAVGRFLRGSLFRTSRAFPRWPRKRARPG